MSYTKSRNGSGISFMVRCHNEESTIGESLESLRALDVDFEIVVALHRCTDRSREIVEEKAAKGLPISFFEVDTPMSLPGYQTLATPADHPNSIMTYYNRCLSKCSKHWLFKWDADFFMTPSLIEFLNSLPDRVDDHVVYILRCVLGEMHSDEAYLSNSIIEYAKHIYWETPMFVKGSSFEVRTDVTIKSIDSEPIKDYWRSDPWFVGVDESIENKYNLISELLGEEKLAMARATSSDWEDSFYTNAKNLEYALSGIGIKLYE